MVLNMVPQKEPDSTLLSLGHLSLTSFSGSLWSIMAISKKVASSQQASSDELVPSDDAATLNNRSYLPVGGRVDTIKVAVERIIKTI